MGRKPVGTLYLFNDKGVLGECPKSEKHTTRHAVFETAYNKPCHNNKSFKDMIVMARQTLEELNDLGACLWKKGL